MKGILMVDLKHALDIAVQAAKSGGAIIQSYWGKIDKIDMKTSESDLVTIADKESEFSICQILKAHFPEHAILAEESGMHSPDRQQDYLWVLDPLDGTTNFTHQFPFVAVSLGLLHQGEPVLGVIYNPITQELFYAVKGFGATLNGKNIKVSKIDSLEKSLLATGFPYNRRETSNNNYKEFSHLTQLTQGVRRVGAASLDLAYVAQGKLDGYWELGLKPWDMVAGIIIVREAGGMVTAYDGSSVDIYSGRVLATNGHLHKLMMEALVES